MTEHCIKCFEHVWRSVSNLVTMLVTFSKVVDYASDCLQLNVPGNDFNASSSK